MPQTTHIVDVKFEGIEELIKVLNSLPEAVARREQIALLKIAAEPMRVEMWAQAPVGPGRHGFHLKDSMTISTVRDKDRSGDATVAVGPAKAAFWGFFQEYGTVNHPPNPFARKSFDNQTHRAFQELSKGYWSLIRRRIQTVARVR